jgi:hypothetical protein
VSCVTLSTGEMGLTASKPKTEEEHLNKHDKFVFDQSKIYFDEFGNIRYGGHDAAVINREAEKTKIMKAELVIDDVSLFFCSNIKILMWL